MVWRMHCQEGCGWAGWMHSCASWLVDKLLQRGKRLAGEVLHDVGQNPIIASSIGKTQHTQVSKASIPAEPCRKLQNCSSIFLVPDFQNWTWKGFGRGLPTDDAAAISSLVRETMCILGYRASLVLKLVRVRNCFNMFAFSESSSFWEMWGRELQRCLLCQRAHKESATQLWYVYEHPSSQTYFTPKTAKLGSLPIDGLVWAPSLIIRNVLDGSSKRFQEKDSSKAWRFQQR